MDNTPARVIGVIPARFASTRLPGKVLASLGDRTILHHVHDRALAAHRLDRVVIATDDERVLREAMAFGATAVLTEATHKSGTDRAAEAVRVLGEDSAFVVNIQGDEPFLDPAAIDAIVEGLLVSPDAIWTAVAPFEDPAVADRVDVVKAALATDGRVLYFSRARIPHVHGDGNGAGLLRHHVGIYGFARETLDRFVRLPPSPLEKAESLEQLRALEAGIPIRAVTISATFGGIDTPEDLNRARGYLARLEWRSGQR